MLMCGSSKMEFQHDGNRSDGILNYGWFGLVIGKPKPNHPTVFRPLIQLGPRLHGPSIEVYNVIIMATLCNRGTIIFLPCSLFLSFYLSFFPRLISAATDWMSTILLHMAWP